MKQSTMCLLLCAMVGITRGLCGAEQALDDPARPLVVDMTTLTPVPRVGPVTEFIGRTTPLVPGTYPVVSGASPDFMAEFRWYHPNDAGLVCEPQLTSLASATEAARRVIVELEFEPAVAALEAAVAQIPCQTVPLSREELSRVFYLEGIATFYMNDRERSAAAFSEALGIAPDLAALPGFPPEVGAAFEASVNAIGKAPPVRFQVENALVQAGVTVDGVALPPSGAIFLLPGRHVAQATNELGVARTTVFQVVAGESRPLSQIANVLPSGSPSYLSALFRTGLQSGVVSTSQARALEVYAGRHRHSAFLLVTVGTDARQGLQLLSFEPGRGLRVGPPPGLGPLPPVKDPTPVAAGSSASSQAKKPDVSSNGAVQDGGKTALQESTRSSSALGASVGLLGYSGALFTSFSLNYAFPVWKVIRGRVALTGASDLGLRGDEQMTMVGLFPGLGVQFPVRPVYLEGGLGVQGLLARVLDRPEGSRLSVEVTPAAWVEPALRFASGLGVGLRLSAGYSPGFLGPAPSRLLWTAGLQVAWHPLPSRRGP